MAEKESIDIVLSATDNATAVIKKSAGEMELLRDRVEQTSKSTAKGSESIQKFANVLGAGWITDSAAQLKELSEAGKGAMEALKGGGSGALALKAGLVGLAAIAGYKVGEQIAEWVFQTKKFAEELTKATEQSRKLGAEIQAVELSRINRDVADVEKFGTTMEGEDEATLKARLEIEQKGKAGQVELAKAALATLESKRSIYLVSQQEVDAAKANLETLRASKKVYDDILQSRFSEGAVARREWEAQQQQRQDGEKQALDNRKKLTEAFFKFQEDMAKQYAREEEKQQKAKEKATLKQMDLQIKAAANAIKATEKEISDLEKIKVDTNTSLQGREERVLSRSTAAGGIESQQLAVTKKQTMILERQEKLAQETKRLLELQAKKEEKVFEISGGA